MFRALFRLFVNEILFLFVTPPNVISRPLFVSSTTILSHAMEPTFVIFPSLRSRLAPIISVNDPSFASFAPIMTPSIDPPSISAVVTVPRSEITVVAKVVFFPKTIDSLPVVVLN